MSGRSGTDDENQRQALHGQGQRQAREKAKAKANLVMAKARVRTKGKQHRRQGKKGFHDMEGHEGKQETQTGQVHRVDGNELGSR